MIEGEQKRKIVTRLCGARLVLFCGAAPIAQNVHRFRNAAKLEQMTLGMFQDISFIRMVVCFVRVLEKMPGDPASSRPSDSAGPCGLSFPTNTEPCKRSVHAP